MATGNTNIDVKQEFVTPISHKQESQKPVIQSPIYRVLQAAEYLNISASTMRRLLEVGSIPKIRLSKSAFGILKTDLDAFIQQNRQA
jgi:excisionase family DNA binding protein